jgi:hypothetical protein
MYVPGQSMKSSLNSLKGQAEEFNAADDKCTFVFQ